MMRQPQRHESETNHIRCSCVAQLPQSLEYTVIDIGAILLNGNLRAKWSSAKWKTACNLCGAVLRICRESFEINMSRN